MGLLVEGNDASYQQVSNICNPMAAASDAIIVSAKQKPIKMLLDQETSRCSLIKHAYRDKNGRGRSTISPQCCQSQTLSTVDAVLLFNVAFHFPYIQHLILSSHVDVS